MRLKPPLATILACSRYTGFRIYVPWWDQASSVTCISMSRARMHFYLKESSKTKLRLPIPYTSLFFPKKHFGIRQSQKIVRNILPTVICVSALKCGQQCKEIHTIFVMPSQGVVSLVVELPIGSDRFARRWPRPPSSPRLT